MDVIKCGVQNVKLHLTGILVILFVIMIVYIIHIIMNGYKKIKQQLNYHKQLNYHNVMHVIKHHNKHKLYKYLELF